MEKNFKPVPNVDCLKYKGTSEKPDIKIFVSHRIDLDSETIDNPLYIPVRCGATFDERSEEEIGGMLGDDTGDNISEKRMSFCEFTVQYWAWKNVRADYYGLCHYRRYVSFSDVFFDECNNQRFVFEPYIAKETVEKYTLLSQEKMTNTIDQYDVITSVTYEVSSEPILPKCNTVRDLFARNPQLLTSYKDIELMQRIVKEKFPQYYTALSDELDSDHHRGFNCYIMKKELFQLICEYEFGVLFELEKKIPFINNPRELAYLGEILYGSFIRWVNEQKKYKVKETQIVFFLDTQHRHKVSFVSAAKLKLKNGMKKFFVRTMPAYRVALRTEQNMFAQNNTMAALDSKINFLNAKIDILTAELRMLSQREMSLFWTTQRQFKSDENKLCFWRSCPKATGDLRMIQEAQLTLLKKLKNICDDASTPFWLHGGCLVGALRHSGFIPWCFDISVGMMREDYYKLRDYINNNLDADRYVITENYYLHIAARVYRFKREDIKSNYAVNIVVYDKYNFMLESPVSDWLSLMQQKRYMASLLADTQRELGEYPDEPTLNGFDELKKKANGIFDKFISRSQGSSESKYILWGMDNAFDEPGTFAAEHGRIFEKQDIFPLVEHEFEGVKFNIPNNYDKYTFMESGTRYIELPVDIYDNNQWRQFFATREDIDNAARIIEGAVSK